MKHLIRITILGILLISFPLHKSEKINTKISNQTKIELCNHSKDCVYLAQAVYFEARGESKEGQIMVMNVINNRANYPSTRFPDTIKGVVTQGCEFSYRCDGSMNQSIDKDLLNKIKITTFNFIEGKYGYNKLVLFYHRYKMKKNPYFVKSMIKYEVVGNHIFYECKQKYC